MQVQHREKIKNQSLTNFLGELDNLDGWILNTKLQKKIQK